MLSQLSEMWQFNFWRGLASVGAGLVIISPCLLFPSLRRRILRSDLDIEGVGFLALIVAIVTIGCYNYISAIGA